MNSNPEPLLLTDFPNDETRRSFSKECSEIIIAFVAAVGVNLKHAEDAVDLKLKELGYTVIRIRVTEDVFPHLEPQALGPFQSDYTRIWKMMEVGTEARKRFGSSIIALGIAAAIEEKRPCKSGNAKTAFLVHSLKHPEEVRCLREIYPRGFHLIGVHSPPDSRRKYLTRLRGIGAPEAKKLMDRDHKETRDCGQQLVDTFHLSDFFTGWEENDDSVAAAKSIQLLKNSVDRFIEIVFGHPNQTPTFGEYAMFLACSTALRSADLSRQVGAVIARNGEILGLGANDCPRSGGGLYWKKLDYESLKFVDFPLGRDWTRSVDTNRKEQIALATQIAEIVGEEMSSEVRTHVNGSAIESEVLEKLERGLVRKLGKVLATNSRIADLTEFGRVVHAEMEALLACARNGISTIGATLYSTTFPCHNCAKHIIAAGIKRVVFIQPYLKSRALAFHSEAVEIKYPVLSHYEAAQIEKQENPKVRFEPFFGIGPRRFFDLFSTELGVGYPITRKEKPTGGAKLWSAQEARVRLQMISDSYLERERAAVKFFEEAVRRRSL